MKPISFFSVRIGAISLLSISHIAVHAQNSKTKKQEIKKTNIIIYLADDLGSGDLGCYGQKLIETPNLDKMAKQGVKFTNAYCGSPVCAPSRSVLMQGLHSGHATVRNNQSNVTQKEVFFNDTTFTVAHLLKKDGYITAIFGKWGMGNPNTIGMPNFQGFDEFFGIPDQRVAHHYYLDSIWHNNKSIPVSLSEEKQYASCDLYFDKAKQFIKANSKNPFFVYLPTQLHHLEMPYKPSEKYKNKPWPDGEKRYATMIEKIDNQMGELIKLIDSLGISEHTLIIFTSDNGGGSGQRNDYHYLGFFKSNGDLRGGKRDLYEGGIRVPFLAYQKNKIPQNQTIDEPIAFYDLMPTLGELSNVQPTFTDGQSILSLLYGKSKKLNREYLYWEFPYMDIKNSKIAVRMGNWKGVKEYINQPLQLYNLSTDPNETANFAKENPEIVRRMVEIITIEHKPSLEWRWNTEIK